MTKEERLDFKNYVMQTVHHNKRNASNAEVADVLRELADMYARK